jgi:hypothetical protein
MPAVPCTDPRGCPDLFPVAQLLSDWLVVTCDFTPTGAQCDSDVFSSYYNRGGCAVQEGFARYGTNRLLIFSFATGNRGPGDLVIGAPLDHPDWFSFVNCHHHPHFKEYADYRLWTAAGYDAWVALRAANPGMLSRDLLDANPQLRQALVEARKLGFCAIDTAPLAILGVPPPGPPRYADCTTGQGIDVSWADVYDKTLDGQWFDITNVPGGAYVIEVEANAEHFFAETSYTNNSAALPITLSLPSPTLSATATSGPTATRTLTATPTRTATATRGTVGGRSFALRAGPATMSWVDGTAETGYLVLRWAPGGSTIVLPPGGTPLPATTSSYSDPAPPADPACYATLPFEGSRALAISDLLCLVPNSASPTGAPGAFTLRLDESRTASLTWTSPGVQEGYVLVAFRADGGAPPTLIPLAIGATSRTHETGGAPTCYTLFAMAGGAARGNSDILCAIPDIADFSGAASTAPLMRALQQLQQAPPGRPVLR